ncbi:hypothetical protein DFA_00312 [Cavenderia fasciculata]|uniref:Transmembrane protein n=1 Tax=Cavenderia fasciculata TaxID=261658 RepID=F4PY74_CACFS|nr:uncharacterized protein DFA_00312 [Cavenderia fasciculata]EGG19734.1 hypothetical protein DFA_00312 [Cavenderia fasciculata]|eukprot:XP_004358028.1 hypothetical protein DFA_00312 [Cavenderia fasciculata]
MYYFHRRHSQFTGLEYLLVASWILIISSFPTYWYQKEENGLKMRFNYKQIEYEDKDGMVWQGEFPNAESRELSVYRAAFAFDIIGFMILSITICLVSISFFPCKLAPWLSSITKYFPIGALVFCIVSVVIFAGALKEARHKDCVKIHEYCDDKMFDFIVQDYNGLSQHPIHGWAFLIIATIFLTCSTISSIAISDYTK